MTVAFPNRTNYSIVKIVRDHEHCSRAEIARKLKMNPSTIGRLVDNLIASNVIKEQHKDSTNGVGRPPKLLRLNLDFSSVLTVDLRSTVGYAAITNLAGDILEKCSRPLRIGDPSTSLSDLINLIRDLLSISASAPPVEIIIIGAPSIVDAYSGVIEWAQSFGWNKLPLRQILEDEFDKTVIVENDVNLAVMGEYWKGAGRPECRNLVFVSVGTGIGAGIILNGELYRGSSNAAGEVAYFITDVDVLRDNVGRAGNLENRAGSVGLIRSADVIASRYPASALALLFHNEQENVHPNQIIELALKGDPASIIVYNELVNILTIVICNISVLLDLDMIILGSPIDLRFQDIIPAIKHRIDTTLLRPINLIASQLDKDAVVFGGAFYALQALKVFES